MTLKTSMHFTREHGRGQGCTSLSSRLTEHRRTWLQHAEYTKYTVMKKGNKKCYVPTTNRNGASLKCSGSSKRKKQTDCSSNTFGLRPSILAHITVDSSLLRAKHIREYETVNSNR